MAVSFYLSHHQFELNPYIGVKTVNGNIYFYWNFYCEMFDFVQIFGQLFGIIIKLFGQIFFKNLKKYFKNNFMIMHKFDKLKYMMKCIQRLAIF